ncbi:MAG: hypothetical protein HDT27_02020 [Subdoligranulum sp.]|nr:hypothetical protein [Subdoligranulum sp.]
MDKSEWDRAKEQLQQGWPCGLVTLVADGYEVTLRLQPVDLMRNGIVVFVNNKFRSRWLIEDSEERRRFLPQREIPAMNRKAREEWNKLPKRTRERLMQDGVDPNRTYTVYTSHWTSWGALVKHFEAHNADIRIKEAAEC